MNAQAQCLLTRLEALAASIRDPVRRTEVQRIIARLAHRDQEWPDDTELMRIRLRQTDGAN